MNELRGRTIFITGASRGVGLAMAVRAARDGANVVIAATTETPHPVLPGTIHTAAAAVEAAGGRALPLVVDVRHETTVAEAIDRTVHLFGRIDAVINNASAIHFKGIEEIDMRRFDLMYQTCTRAALLVSKYAIPHLRRAANPHILMLAPPIETRPEVIGAHTPYSIAKLGVSLMTAGLSWELREAGIAVNALWPRTAIDTAAIRNLMGGNAAARRARKPEIVADAAHAILAKPSRAFTGNFLFDDVMLAREGVKDFRQYAIDPSQSLDESPFVPAEQPGPVH
jgi:citronellol/citronellal dehydrogenase